jgi:hypothetical protein
LRYIQINLKDSGYAAKRPVIADKLSIAQMLSPQARSVQPGKQ